MYLLNLVRVCTLNLVPTCTCACTTVVRTAVLNLVPTCTCACTAVVRQKAKQTAM